MSKPKLHKCKVGTIPAFVVLKAGCKPILGRTIWFRQHNGIVGQWETGIVDGINADGYFFINRM